MALNPYNPTCSVSPCLLQIIGFGNNNGVAQYAACTSLFGAPTVSTFTPTETSYMTATSTVTYVDVIVSVSTSYSTVESVSTIYSEVLETITAYTSTIVLKSTAVSTASRGNPLKKRRKQKRGVCKPKSSSSLSLVSSTSSETSSSETPSSTSSSAQPTSSEASSTEEPSSPPTSSSLSTPLFPIATNCPSLEEYSSACSCIRAVSSTSTFTDVASTPTSITTTVVSTAIPSVTETTSTVLISTTVVTTVVTTSTSTFLTDTTTITTVVSTVVPSPPAASQTAALRVLSPASLAGRRLSTSGNPIGVIIQSSVDAAGTAIVLPTSSNESGMQPFLASSPNLRLYLQNNSSVRQRLIFVTAGTAAGSAHNPVTCRVDAQQTLACTRTNNGWTRLIQCGNDVFMASPTYVNAACTELTLRVDI